MNTITCKIPEKLDAELEALAERRAVSKSTIVREALEQNIQRQKEELGLSAYALMKEACGIVKTSSRDLGSNPKHLKGFGR